MKNKKLKFIIFLFFFAFLSLYLITAFQLSHSNYGSSIEITDLNIQNADNSNFIHFDSKLDTFLEDKLGQVNQFEMVDVIITLSYQPKLDDGISKGEKVTTFTNLIQNSQNKIISIIENDGGTVNHEFSIINAISASISIKTLKKLINLESIARIEYDYEIKMSLDYSVDTILDPSGYSYSWNSSFNGTGIVVAVLDSGIHESHAALQGRILDKYNAFDFSTNVADDEVGTPSHGTHVAGCIASNDTTYTGVSPAVSLIIAKVFDSTGSGQSTQLMIGAEWAVTTASPKADIINFSGGSRIVGGDDGQHSLAFFIDAIVSTYDVLWINAAGNSGSSSGTIEIPADAYNSIAVGNMVSGNNAIRLGDSIAGSSSRGPTYDLRIKPEIVAPGSSIYSPQVSGWSSVTGTSFSAPHVTGAAALLYQYFKEELTTLESKYYPLVTKAALIHTAEDWGTAGVDNNYGFGYINMPDMWNFTQNGYFYGESVASDYVTNRAPSFYNVTINTSEIFNMTFVWNRHARYVSPNVYYYGSGVPNNFDLYLLDKNGTIVSYSNDTLNNIEQISYTSYKDDYYYLRIDIEGDLEYSAEEAFGLVSSHNLDNFTIPIPSISFNVYPDIDLNLNHLLYFTTFDVNEKIRITATSSSGTEILYGQVLVGDTLSDMSIITSTQASFVTNVLIDYIPQGYLLTSLLSGISVMVRVKVYDSGPITSHVVKDFEITVHGFMFDIIPPIVIVLGTLIAIDFIRDRRVKAIYKEYQGDNKKDISKEVKDPKILDMYCPGCGMSIQVLKSEKIKFSCPYCNALVDLS